MAVIRKVQSKVILPKKEEKKKTKETTKEVVASDAATESEKQAAKKTAAKKKVCYFCQSKTEPKYWDTASLRRCLSDRGRIYSRTRTGACAKHQRRISREIKHARQLAMLPFRVGV